MTGSEAVLNLVYLLAAVLFVMQFKLMSRPKTAPLGNLLGSTGMLIAVVATLLHYGILRADVALAGMAVGSAIGAFIAFRTPMIAMPQMVGLLNGLGGGASLIVGWLGLYRAIHEGVEIPPHFIASVIAAGIIGGVTFLGSMVAFAKLQWRKFEKAIVYPGMQVVKLGLLAASVGAGLLLALNPLNHTMYWVMVALAMALGVALTISIGGADMPVVISLLNAYSGLAAAATGFVLNNTMLIIAGSLVGTSGIILTNLMCKAMNRSFLNVLAGGFGAEVVHEKDFYAGRIRRATAEDVAALLEAARTVAIVPGYGMAVAGAHIPLKELVDILRSRGVEVFFAIHPVAGRMPGHMYVLLSEAGIPYELMKGVEEANALMESVDVAIVVGANDVVNPLAETDPNCPLAGMPIIQVYKARTVIVIKRSLRPGFAGIPNPLFIRDNTMMYFEDARKAIVDIIGELKGRLTE